MNSKHAMEPGRGLAGRMAAAFVDAKITPIIIVASVLLGLAATWMLPREEEPQILVPMIDVYVSMPGASAHEVEERVSRPMEQLLWEVAGVEYVYSTSMPEQSMVIVRFEVGYSMERALILLNQKLQANFDRIPHGVTQPLVRPRSIDDVPVLALTLYSDRYGHADLRRVMAQIQDAVKSIPQVAETTLIGGVPRELRILLDPELLASRELTALEVASRLQAANRQSYSDGMVSGNKAIRIQSGVFLRDAESVGRVVVGVFAGRPVYLREVAEISEHAADPDQYVFFSSEQAADPQAAVTLSVAKRPGANAITVVERVLAQVEQLKEEFIPEGMSLSVTRDYGHTAKEKSDELLLHMGIAVIGVSLLILFFLGWRESLVVAIAIPSTLALTLFVFYLYGYTLNRITLFALIFSIGILVDDAIVVVENIVRHMRLKHNRDRSLTDIAVEAVNEVGNPTILATLAVIAAILPMAFVGGLMGPYMRPIPIGSTAAMLFSLLIAFMVTPWAAVRILRWRRSLLSERSDLSPNRLQELPNRLQEKDQDQEKERGDWTERIYHGVMEPMMEHGRWRWIFLAGIVLALLAAMILVPLKQVKIKMLPFDNKSEFQVIVEMPEGTPLESTAAVSLDIAGVLRELEEVRDVQVYVGTAAPFNFNGLVRHYYARTQAHQADIQVNLVAKNERSRQSHEIAKSIRPLVTEIGKRYGAVVAVAEVPPGPPVLQTMVVEVYAPDDASRMLLAKQVKDIFARTEGMADIDWYVEAPQQLMRFRLDTEKAALHGITQEDVARTVSLAVDGLSVDLLHLPREKEDVNIVFRLPRDLRSHPEALLALRLRSAQQPDAPLIALRELVHMEEEVVEPYRYRKNMTPVIYVTAEVAGLYESPAYAMADLLEEIRKLDACEFGGKSSGLAVYHLNQPFSDSQPAVKFDGEWHITLEVFRDLGMAFIAVLILIYMLMVGWFKSFITPFVVMSAIPFSLIGILPAHWAAGAFFTATSMIGFMAGAGIVVRNSIILVDFIEMRVQQGMQLSDAVVEAGAVRFRPMLLTALAVVVGASVILTDPIFQGLAISLMAGEVASLFISRFAVPIIYYMVHHRYD